MPISISSAEREVLTHYNQKSQALAIDTNKQAGVQLVAINLSDITLPRRILGYFGLGLLGSKQISLFQVAHYLNRFQWGPAGKTDQAFQAVCKLANQAMLKGDPLLFDHISEKQTLTNIELIQLQNQGGISYRFVTDRILWNPELEVRHLREQLRNHFSHSNVQIKEKESSLRDGEPLNRSNLSQLKIEVRQNLTFDSDFSFSSQ